MKLLAILLAYSLERALNMGRDWQWRRILLRWQHWQTSQNLGDWRQHFWGEVAWALIPALLIGFILTLLDNVLLTFIVAVVSLVLTMQCSKARAAYKNYLAAANDGDTAAVAEHLRTIRVAAGRNDAEPVHRLLLWIHLRHYFAILLYFVLFGVFGVLAYASLRDMRHPHNETWRRLQLVINWLPTRLMSFGFLLVGNFSKALPVWLNSVGNTPQNNFKALAKVAEAAEDLHTDNADDITSTALTTVALVKRNLLLYIVLLAVMTIVGWL